MDITNLPTPLVLIGRSAEVTELTRLLNMIFDAKPRHFTHFDIIHGSERSGRILYQTAHTGAVLFPAPHTGYRAAMSLCELAKTGARYQGSRVANQRFGWEIHKCTTEDGSVAAIAWTAWV
jgi:hypothetical protein